MDVLVEIAKAAATFGLFFMILIAIPVLFVFIFEIATGIDERLSR